MISKKKYLKALTIVKEYEKQLRIGGVVCSAGLKTKNIVLDDCWFGVEIDGEDNKMVNSSEFMEVVDILLNKEQYNNYIADFTCRVFDVDIERINKMFTHINSPNNIWRTKR